MSHLIQQFHKIKKDLELIINKQLTLGYFLDWEEWFESHFDPINNEYDRLYQKILDSDLIEKPEYVNFKSRVQAIMINDCDMKLYD